VSERKQKYQTKRKPTKADEPLTITLTRGDWASVSVALAYLSKVGGLGDGLARKHRGLAGFIAQELER
jgi:hypothetical protein